MKDDPRDLKDREDLERWRQDDQRAGHALCTRYFDAIHRFFERKLPDKADDLTQQTFLACQRGRDQFRGHSSFRTYLYTIARNELYMQLRKQPKFEHVDLESSSLNELVASPSYHFGKAQDLAALHAALCRLPVEQQVLLEFRYWHDLDAAELAEIFKVTPIAIRVRLLRARQALKQLLGDDLGDVNDLLSRSRG